MIYSYKTFDIGGYFRLSWWPNYIILAIGPWVFYWQRKGRTDGTKWGWLAHDEGGAIWLGRFIFLCDHRQFEIDMRKDGR